MNAETPRTLVYARLVRLPNVFTAIADIALGAVVSGVENVGPRTAALVGSSACLYSAGMVWNDLFDFEQDWRERPQRPLPSGQVSRRTAAILAIVLTAGGWGLAFFAGRLAAILAGILVIAILLYDRWLKRTPVGPLGMGACRFLNVLLGLAAVDAISVDWGLRLHLAAVVGFYVVGVTWFARREASVSQSRQLSYAAAIVVATLIVALALPLHVAAGTASPVFPYLLVVFGAVVVIPMQRAIRRPKPEHVQSAVRTAILGIIALDAVLATAISGWYGLLILLLLPPAVILGRRVYST
jgi:4-hydroxybenzoate polyprenyltransferase